MIPKNALKIPFRYSSFIHNFHQEKNLSAFYDEKENSIFFQFIPDKKVEGPPNHVHGGYLASILDEAMGAIMFISGYFGLTNHFEIDYKKPVPLQKTHYIQSRIEKVQKRKIYISARIFSGNTIYTFANAIFFQFDFHRLGLTPEYQWILQFHQMRKEGKSIKESINYLKNKLPTS